MVDSTVDERYLDTQNGRRILRTRLLFTDGKGSFQETAWEKPEITADEIEVRSVMTGVCRSDIDMMNGLFGPLPINMHGHEGLGQVTAVGADRVRTDHRAAVCAADQLEAVQCQVCAAVTLARAAQFSLRVCHGLKSRSCRGVRPAEAAGQVGRRGRLRTKPRKSNTPTGQRATDCGAMAVRENVGNPRCGP
jgi:hypothetical protein